VGLNAVIEEYKWVAQWNSAQGQVTSSCWPSTVNSLGQLALALRTALDTPSDASAFDACVSIFAWGGERNVSVGARPFLQSKLDTPNGLCDYLNRVRASVTLASADLANLGAVEQMNSMLTKVYALASTDGLPIYDSRVAAAMACLVEIYRHNNCLNWTVVPDFLMFPGIPEDGKNSRRHVGALQQGKMLVATPGVIRYLDPKRATRWISAAVRLGWVINAVLSRKPDLLAQQTSRMHAFEACLFMIGYDVSCLRRNLNP